MKFRLDCESHPSINGNIAWIVCSHVIDGAKPAFAGPDPEEPRIGGAVICSKCHADALAHRSNLKNFFTVCQSCVMARWPQAGN